MTESRTVARWFFAAMLVVPAVRNAFSYAGQDLLGALSPHLDLGLSPEFLSMGTGHSLFMLALGLGIVAALSYLAVSRWNAPIELWYVPAAFSLLQVAHLGYSAGVAWLMGGLAVPSEVVSRIVTSVPYVSPYIYFSAAVGYPLAAWLGCFLGAKRKSELAPLPLPEAARA